MVKPDAKYSTFFLPAGATKGFKRHRSTRYEIIRKIVCLKIQSNPLMNLWWSLFLENHTYHLIINFTENEHYSKVSIKSFALCFKSTSQSFKNFQNIFERRVLGLSIVRDVFRTFDEHLWWSLFTKIVKDSKPLTIFAEKLQKRSSAGF